MNKQILLNEISKYINESEDIMKKSSGEVISNILMIIGNMED